MPTAPSQLRWGRLLVAAVLIWLVSVLLTGVVVFGYAFVLGWQARGAPDQAQIKDFADTVAPWLGRVALVVLTFGAALWVARRTGRAAQVHGLALGALVGLPNLVVSLPPGLADVGTLLLAVLAGWGGSLLAGKTR
ncbi:MAG: hypothetical protein ONB14_02360 [candidate division KSB1 bacterium]|nr:hypothetical protein [candidate division KSB1 bacterium]MDZ7413575.1 hypothetical protein [candidate division KSB1 bacterium]